MSNNDLELSNRISGLDLTFGEAEEIQYNSQNEYEICKNCDTTFGDFQARVAHICKPYKCIYCDDRFLYDYQLKMHETECSGYKETDDSANAFHCSSCNSTFETLKLLSQHKNLCFTKDSAKKCNVCKEEFKGRICKNCKLKGTENNKQKIKDKNYSLRHNSLYNGIQNASKIHIECEFTSSSEDSEHAAEVKKYPLRRNRILSTQSSDSNVPDSSDKQSESSELLDTFPQNDECDKPAKDVQIREKTPDVLRKTRKLRHSRFVKTEHLSKKMNSETKRKAKKLDVKWRIDEFSSMKASQSPESKLLLTKIKDAAENKKDIKKLDEPDMRCKTESSNSSTSNSSYFPDKKSETSVSQFLDENFKAKDVSTVSNFMDDSVHFPGILAKKFLVSCNKVLDRKDPTNLSMKRKVVDDGDSETNFRTNDVKSLKQENCKSVCTNTLETVQEVQKSDTELSTSKPSTSNTPSELGQDSNKEVTETSVPLKMRKKKYRKVSNSKITENLVPAPKPSSSNAVLDTNNKSSSIPNNFERELEVSQCTLNSIPEDLTDSSRLLYYNDKGMEENIDVSPVTRINKSAINLECIQDILPDETCGFLLKVAATTSDSYRCPKCSKLFKKIKTGSTHYSSCKSARFRKNLHASIDEIVFICTNCHFHCSQVSELTTHNKTCTQKVSNNISDCIRHYRNTSKNYVCNKCCYSCLSLHALSQHPCDERLDTMKTCVVGVKKLSSNDLEDFDNLIRLQCSACNAVFFDDTTFEKHSETHLNDGIKFAKTYITKGKECVRKEIEKVIKGSDTCNSVDSFIKNIVEPISRLNSIADPENKLPDLKADFTMPYENQKLLEAAAKELFSMTNFSSFKDKNAEKEKAIDNMGFDMSKTRLPEHIASEMIHPGCDDCRYKRTDPNMDVKPCTNCLNWFLQNYVKKEMNEDLTEKEETIPSNNASNIILINNVVSGIRLPSSDSRNVATSASTSAFNTSFPQNSAAPTTSADFSQTSCEHRTELESADQEFEAAAARISDKTLQEIVEQIFDDTNNFTVKFTFGSASVEAHYDFDSTLSYSAYIIKASRLLVCSACMVSFTPSQLMEHLVDVHKKADIKIFII